MVHINRLLIESITFGTGGHIRVWTRDHVDGGQVLTYRFWMDLAEWCEHNCQGRYWVGMGLVDFEHEDDALLFRMRWL